MSHPSELMDALGAIATELHSDHVCLSRLVEDATAVQTVMANDGYDGGKTYLLADHDETARVIRSAEMTQVFVDDPAADPAERSWLVEAGYATLLMAPVLAGAVPVGLLEVCCREPRPWSRSEIYRARVMCHQLAAVLERLRLVDRDALARAQSWDGSAVVRQG